MHKNKALFAFWPQEYKNYLGKQSIYTLKIRDNKYTEYAIDWMVLPSNHTTSPSEASWMELVPFQKAPRVPLQGYSSLKVL